MTVGRPDAVENAKGGTIAVEPSRVAAAELGGDAQRERWERRDGSDETEGRWMAGGRPDVVENTKATRSQQARSCQFGGLERS